MRLIGFAYIGNLISEIKCISVKVVSSNGLLKSGFIGENRILDKSEKVKIKNQTI
jgi:hypothetical protein